MDFFLRHNGRILDKNASNECGTGHSPMVENVSGIIVHRLCQSMICAFNLSQAFRCKNRSVHKRLHDTTNTTNSIGPDGFKRDQWDTVHCKSMLAPLLAAGCCFLHFHLSLAAAAPMSIADFPIVIAIFFPTEKPIVTFYIHFLIYL